MKAIPQIIFTFFFVGQTLAAFPEEVPTLKEAEGEADHLDPGWRLSEINAKRAKIAPELNGALRVAEIFKSLPKEWKELNTSSQDHVPIADLKTLRDHWNASDETLTEPPRPADPALLKKLITERAKYASAIAKARELDRYASGRAPITMARNILDTPLPDTQNARVVVRLLQFDGQIRALEGDIAGALASARAILGVSRSVGDEPFAISQLVRMAIDSVAVDLITKALSRGETTDAALAVTQDALSDEAKAPLLLTCVRGERAAMYDLLGKLATGEVNLEQLSGGKPKFEVPRVIQTALFQTNQAAALQLMNQGVEIAKRPLWEQMDLWKEWESKLSKQRKADPIQLYSVAHLLMPAFVPLAEAHLRTRSILRTAELSVGLERARLAKQRWPHPDESLLPAFKDGLPIDPFTGKPLKWKRTDTGMVVYSLSLDRIDNGGKLENHKFQTPGTDIGFRQWDVSRRGILP